MNQEPRKAGKEASVAGLSLDGSWRATIEILFAPSPAGRIGANSFPIFLLS